MARIELRNATIRLVDGYANTAAVNDTPLTGDTTMSVDTLGEQNVIPVSSRFTVVGSTRKYTVTASDANAQFEVDIGTSASGNFTITVNGQTTASIAYNANAAAVLAALELLSTVEVGDFSVTGVGSVADPWVITALSTGELANVAVTLTVTDVDLDDTVTRTIVHAGGVTHDITFTPALATADGIPSDGAVITVTGRTLEVKVGDGNLEFTEHREFTYDLDRGQLDTVRLGDDVPMDVSLDFVWEFLTAMEGVETPTISDVLHHRGPAASWESSSADQCEEFAIDIEIEHEQPCGDEDIEIITLPDFRWEDLPHSATDAQVSMTGRCNATEALVSRL